MTRAKEPGLLSAKCNHGGNTAFARDTACDREEESALAFPTGASHWLNLMESHLANKLEKCSL